MTENAAWEKAVAAPAAKLMPLLDVAVPPLGAPLGPIEQRELQTCEVIIQRHRQGFLATARALHTIWEKRLWRETHSSFESYCRQKWDLGKSQAYRYLEGYKLAEGTPNAEGLNGAAMRVLACAAPAQRQELIDMARKKVQTAMAPLFAGSIQEAPADEDVSLTAADLETVIHALHTLAPAQQMEIVAGAEQQLIDDTRSRLPGVESERRSAEDYRLKLLRLLERARKIAARYEWLGLVDAIRAAQQAAPVLPEGESA
jgi:hypothetical protein